MQSIEYRIREIEVETKQPMFVGKYTQHITVYCVGVLRCHLPSLLLDPQACLDLFQGYVYCSFTIGRCFHFLSQLKYFVAIVA